MAVWSVHGSVVMDIYAEVEADTIEEAIEICENDVRVTEYCDGTIGVDYNDDCIEDVETDASGNWVSWEECA